MTENVALQYCALVGRVASVSALKAHIHMQRWFAGDGHAGAGGSQLLSLLASQRARVEERGTRRVKQRSEQAWGIPSALSFPNRKFRSGINEIACARTNSTQARNTVVHPSLSFGKSSHLMLG